MYMESRIPIPTDNIYKFYALFGVLLFVFCIGSLIYINNSTNELVFSASPEYKALESIDHLTSIEVAKKQVLEKRVEIALADKKFSGRSIGVIWGISILLIIYGFVKWQLKVQPIQDEMAQLQLEKIRLEVEALRMSLKKE